MSAAAHPVPHILAFLRGTWRLTRRIVDHRAARTLTAEGTARWTDAPGGACAAEAADALAGAGAGSAGETALSYCEECVVHGLGAAAVPARASYVYTALRGAPSAAAVSFPDGRAFHALDLATGDSGALAHACAPDAYAGRVVATGAHTLTVEWRVTGPAKDYVALTHLTRECGGAPAAEDAGVRRGV